MDHFDLTQWTDYVRGVVTLPEKEVMANHLTEGCDRCTHLFALVSRIHQASAEEPVVPEHLVDSAKAVFSSRISTSRVKSLSPLPVHLVYTNAMGAIAGSRSALDASVQAVYHAGDYAIDLQIEPETETNEMALVGQVVKRSASDEPLSGVPVLLTVRNRQVAESHSNRFGEFCLVVRAQRGLTLCLEIEDAGNRVEIPLTQILAGRQ